MEIWSLDLPSEGAAGAASHQHGEECLDHGFSLMEVKDVTAVECYHVF
jgi:hypothetical protein